MPVSGSNGQDTVSDARVECWGCNPNDETAGVCDQAKNIVPANYSTPSKLAVGSAHTCAALVPVLELQRAARSSIEPKQVDWWGDNSHGQLDVPFGVSPESNLVAGDDATCSLTESSSSGEVTCRGKSDLEVLRIPKEVQGKAVSITAGAEHACVTYYPMTTLIIL